MYYPPFEKWQTMEYRFKTHSDLIRSLHDKKSCREFLEQQRWNGMPVCPHCNHKSEHHYKLKFGGEFNGLYKCPKCRKRFTVTVGTMFEGSKLSLEKWFEAILEFLSNKKGISSIYLSKKIGVTQKTAWFILNRIRYNLSDPELTKLNGLVQIDETYMGGKSKGRFKFNRGRSLKQKTPVVGVLTTEKVYAIVAPDTTGKTLKTIVYGLVERGSTVVTDEWPAYRGISKAGYIHEVVTHHTRQYVNERGFHTNGIEGFWSHLKRGVRGIYHSASPKHLQLYCDEFAYRYSTRMMTDFERFMQFIVSMHRRLSYSELICEPMRL